MYSTPLDFGDRWRMLGELGSGAYGVVYHCKDTKTKHHVAIKVAFVKGEANALKNEARLYRLLTDKYHNHSGFLKFHHFKKNGENAAFLVMEKYGLTAWKALRLYRKKHARNLPLPLVAKIGINVVKILRDLHDTGHIHHDVKPDNILLHENNLTNVKLIDFGLARMFMRDNGTIIAYGPESNQCTSYSSLAHRLGQEVGERDDYEALAYSLIALFKGTLPWISTMTRGTRSDKNRELELMQKMPLAEVCEGMGTGMELYLAYLRNLPDFMRPNADYLLKVLGMLE